MTIEHAFCYAGKQISELWNYVPLCWFHHLGKALKKWINELIALRRATAQDLAKYPNRNWLRDWKNLEFRAKNEKISTPDKLVASAHS